MDSLNAYILNCTLKKSPTPSHTGALLDKIVKLYRPLGVECEAERVVDYNVPFGIASDLGAGDDWPKLLKKIVAADIFIIATPIWFGVRSSVAQLVIERLDGTYDQGDPETGQFPLYNTVGGVVVTGNEDGAHAAAESTLFNLTHLGCFAPPNADCYWVGDAGPGPSYMDAGGDKHAYTDKTARYMTYNTAWLARLLKKHPIDSNLKQMSADAARLAR